MAKKPGKKNKNKKSSNYNAQKPIVAQDVADDISAEQVVESAEVENDLQAAKSNEAKQLSNEKQNLKAEKSKKDQKNKKQPKKEARQNRVKESVAELKKVTWPTFNQVVKNTLLVLGIVLIFTIVLFGIDYGLSWIYKLLTPAA